MNRSIGGGGVRELLLVREHRGCGVILLWLYKRLHFFLFYLKKHSQIITLIRRLGDGQLRTQCDRESGVGYVAKSGAASVSSTTRLTERLHKNN